VKSAALCRRKPRAARQRETVTGPPPSVCPLNCVFDGTSLYVADFGHADTTGAAQMVGRLLRVDVGIRGMPLFSGAIV